MDNNHGEKLQYVKETQFNTLIIQQRAISKNTTQGAKTL